MGTGSPAGDVDTPNGRAASNGPCTEDRQVNELLNDAFVSVLVKSNTDHSEYQHSKFFTQIY